MIFLDIGQTECNLINILVKQWRQKLVSSSKEGQVTLFEWPTLGVGWLSIGTFDLEVIKAVEERVFRPVSLGHSDQVLYRVTYIESSGGPPPPPPMDKSLSFPKTHWPSGKIKHGRRYLDLRRS